MMTGNELAAQAIVGAGDAVVTVDKQCVINSWNSAAEVIRGQTADQAFGQALTLIVPHGYRARHVGAFHTAMGVHQRRPTDEGGSHNRRGDLAVLAMSFGLLTDAAGAVAALRPDAVDLVPFSARPKPAAGHSRCWVRPIRCQMYPLPTGDGEQ